MGESTKYEDENSILCFALKCDWVGSNWFGFGVRCEDKTDNVVNISGAGGKISNYFIVVKQTQIELQSRTGATGKRSLYVEYPNDGIIVLGKWHEVQFEAVPHGNDILIILNVDGKNVMEYLDKFSTVKKLIRSQ